jgi:hypothetical protein
MGFGPRDLEIPLTQTPFFRLASPIRKKRVREAIKAVFAEGNNEEHALTPHGKTRAGV